MTVTHLSIADADFTLHDFEGFNKRFSGEGGYWSGFDGDVYRFVNRYRMADAFTAALKYLRYSPISIAGVSEKFYSETPGCVVEVRKYIGKYKNRKKFMLDIYGVKER